MQIPKLLSLDRDGQYCMNCFSLDVKRLFQNSLTYYKCSICNQMLERSLVIDSKIVWWVDGDTTYWHESVGVLVVVGSKLLVMLRKIFPFSYTIPAGHLDKGEPSVFAAQRELEEETGLIFSELEVIKENFDIARDSCRRGSDHHRWHLYRVILDTIPEISLCDEASEIKWMTLQELKNEPRLTFPLQFFVDTLGEGIFE
jgi:8-oxo-dGTP pyrophosphatase MutT (NUDIX family)